MRNGVSLNMDNLGSGNVADTDGDGIQEIVDAYGTPLAFFRFPTDNALLQNSNPAAGNKNSPSFINADPLDPSGRLSGLLKTPFETNVHKLKSPVNNTACYILPTIVSAGPDGVLGLDQSLANNMRVLPKMDAFTTDNVYSFQLR